MNIESDSFKPTTSASIQPPQQPIPQQPSNFFTQQMTWMNPLP